MTEVKKILKRTKTILGKGKKFIKTGKIPATRRNVLSIKKNMIFEKNHGSLSKLQGKAKSIQEKLNGYAYVKGDEYLQALNALPELLQAIDVFDRCFKKDVNFIISHDKNPRILQKVQKIINLNEKVMKNVSAQEGLVLHILDPQDHNFANKIQIGEVSLSSLKIKARQIDTLKIRSLKKNYKDALDKALPVIFTGIETIITHLG